MNNHNNIVADDRQTPKGQWLVTIILVVPLLVITVSTWMYLSGKFNPVSTTNQGQLILPPISVSSIPVKGERLGESQRWRLILVDNGDCAERCQEWIYWLRQVHTALGKRSERVERVFMTSGEAPTKLTDYPGYDFVELTEDENFWQQNFHRPALKDNIILVADPLGNIMMLYDQNHGGKQILKDVKKMLKVSNIG